MRKALFISQNSIRILLGLMFIASAIMKLLSIDSLILYVFSFQIMSFVMTEIACRLLIGVEILLGIMLILKFRYKWIWWITMGMMIGFTLFLVHTAIFRNDDNCHCFGDIIEVKPLVSIFKNLGIIGVMLLVYGKCERSLCVGWLKNEEGKEKFTCQLVPDRDVFIVENQYSKIAKICIYAVMGLLVFAATFLVFPPNALYNKIFSNNELVATDIFEETMSDSLVFLHYQDIRYDEKNDTVTFRIDTNYFAGKEGTYIIPVVSAGCKHCKRGCELMHNIFERNMLPSDHMIIWVWGYSHEHCASFLRVSKTWKYDVYRISPLLAVNMVYGSFPTFIVVRNGKVIDAFNYRGIDESKIVNYVKETD